MSSPVGAVRDAGPNGELNYWPTAPFYPPNKGRPYAEFSRKAFYKDRRFRETTFIVESLQRSACYRRGQAHCAHCHDVHGKAAEKNLKSLRFQEEPDRMCTQCHREHGARVGTHTPCCRRSESMCYLSHAQDHEQPAVSSQNPSDRRHAECRNGTAVWTARESQCLFAVPRR